MAAVYSLVGQVMAAVYRAETCGTVVGCIVQTCGSGGGCCADICGIGFDFCIENG